MLLPESNFMDKFCSGDPVVLGQIIDQYRIPLAAFASRITITMVPVDDIVQNAFIGLWERCDTIKEEVDIRRYLYASVRNLSINFLRQNKHRAAYVKERLHLDEVEETPIVRGDKVVNIITHIMPLFKQLPRKTREVLLLHFLEDLTDAEIAQRLNTTIKTVHTKKSQGKKQLRELIFKNKSTLDPNLFFLCLFLFADMFNGN
jgi:RNA polymerase sigma-70 factor (ECF subfamily)